jgi:Cys-tRNA(Pro)/Cys-tRNA(Cys) deacylase
MPVSNNVTRLLDAKKIPYLAYDLPVEKLGAIETAQLLNISPSIVYKSIVLQRERPGKPILAIIPGNRKVDEKAIAKFLDEKRVGVVSEKEAERLTGMKVGGISPLALLSRGFILILDAEAEKEKEIHISGGQRGLNIRIAVSDLISLLHPRIASISKSIEES